MNRLIKPGSSGKKGLSKMESTKSKERVGFDAREKNISKKFNELFKSQNVFEDC